jgi:hypothetical protein
MALLALLLCIIIFSQASGWRGATRTRPPKKQELKQNKKSSARQF